MYYVCIIRSCFYLYTVYVLVCVCARAPVILVLFVLKYIHKTYTVFSKHISRHYSVHFYNIISSPFKFFSFLFTPLIFSLVFFIILSLLLNSQALKLFCSHFLLISPQNPLHSSTRISPFSRLIYSSFLHFSCFASHFLISYLKFFLIPSSFPSHFQLVFLISSYFSSRLISSYELTVKAALSQFGHEAFLMESIFQSSE